MNGMSTSGENYAFLDSAARGVAPRTRRCPSRFSRCRASQPCVAATGPSPHQTDRGSIDRLPSARPPAPFARQTHQTAARSSSLSPDVVRWTLGFRLLLDSKRFITTILGSELTRPTDRPTRPPDRPPAGSSSGRSVGRYVGLPVGRPIVWSVGRYSVIS